MHFLDASQASSQPIPHFLSLNYGDIFKIQRVQNPFPLAPVSYSSLASYLECPGCSLERRQKRRSREPKHFTNIHQSALFGRGEPDPRLVGTLLHALVNILHEPGGQLTKTQQENLIANAYLLTDFIRKDVLAILRASGKLNLAIFYDELRQNEKMLYKTLIAPMLNYQREYVSTGTIVLAGSERFQFKLLSTKNTFAKHPDWGGYVALVGEFDQIRLRTKEHTSSSSGVPAIIEFKKGLGEYKKKNPFSEDLFGQLTEGAETDDMSPGNGLPGISHAMQLMIYWMAFQTRWDILEKVTEAKGTIHEIRMPLQQELDLIIYNLNDGCQYQLLPTDHQEALLALTECVFLLNWAMKSGYAGQASEHDCKKTQLVEPPNPSVQVGYTTFSARDCYILAKDAFERFKNTVRWEKISKQPC